MSRRRYQSASGFTRATGGRMRQEYDHEQFWVTDLAAEEPERRHHPDHSSVPIGPWFHRSGCDCEACRARPG